MIIQEINLMNQKYKYDWIFLSTEDDIIRNNLINKFKYKLKYYKYNKHIEYNYKDKKRLCFNKVIRGNINYITIYLINIIILSKCLDIITARTNGSIILFILNNKFRNKKIYYLGNYN
ncbi:MAG: hypothetical protein IJL25_07900 [Clostridia bacterium]|nr:hypothetical protein [Clostridia bacterium]